MRIVLIVLALAALSACASSPLPPSPAGGGVAVVGTLAPLGSFEHEIAPQSTRAEVLAIQTARAIRLGRLDNATGQQIARHLTAARADLAAAIALEAQTRDREAARRRAQPAVQAIEQAAALLRGE